MENQFVKSWEFKPLIEKAISSYIDKYDLKFSNNNSNGIDLKNEKISISISDKYGDFSIGISNGRDYLTINDLVFKKYPNYIEIIKNDKTISPFKLTINDFDLYSEYFMYLVKNGFNFIEENFSQVFKGDFEFE